MTNDQRGNFTAGQTHQPIGSSHCSDQPHCATEDAMKSCPECGIALKDEYQFCPEDGAALDAPPVTTRNEDGASVKPQVASAVVLYCPAGAAEYPLTFSECPVHHTALTTHGVPSLVDAASAGKAAELTAEESSAEERRPAMTRSGRRLHLVAGETAPRHSALEAYEQTLESLARPVTEEGVGEIEDPSPVVAPADGERKHRLAAIVISAALGLLALIGLYAVISNASRKPATPPAKTTSAKSIPSQSPITVPTPQAASDYRNEANANSPRPADHDNGVAAGIQADAAAQARPPRHQDEANSSTPRPAHPRPPIGKDASSAQASARTAAARLTAPASALTSRPIEPSQRLAHHHSNHYSLRVADSFVSRARCLSTNTRTAWLTKPALTSCNTRITLWTGIPGGLKRWPVRTAKISRSC